MFSALSKFGRHREAAMRTSYSIRTAASRKNSVYYCCNCIIDTRHDLCKSAYHNPLISADFCRGRDTAVLDTFSEIQRITPDPFQSSHHLPINLGGAGLDSLMKHARGNYLGTFFRIAGPLYARLLRMGVGVNLALALHLSKPLVTQTIHP